jgi:hypothetical protein
MFIKYLILNYIFAYFLIVIWLSYQLFTYACSKANFRKEKKNSCKFSFVFFFQCETSRRTCSLVRTCAALSINDLAVCCPDKWVTLLNASPLLSQPAAHHYFFFNLSCHVVCVFSLFSPEIFAFSAHLFSFNCFLFGFLYSFSLLYFLE